MASCEPKKRTSNEVARMEPTKGRASRQNIETKISNKEKQEISFNASSSSSRCAGQSRAEQGCWQCWL